MEILKNISSKNLVIVVVYLIFFFGLNAFSQIHFVSCIELSVPVFCLGLALIVLFPVQDKFKSITLILAFLLPILLAYYIQIMQ